MTSIRRTAYPRFQSHLTPQELEEIYQPTEDQLHFVHLNAKGDAQRLTLLLLLKCHQHLGYLPSLELIPETIRHYLCTQVEVPVATSLTDGAEKTLYRYRQLIRTYLKVRSYSQGGAAIVASATHKAAHTMSDPADLINVAIEQLIHHRYELPAFSTLDRQVNHIRQEVHQLLYTRVAARLNTEQRQLLDELLEVQPGQRSTNFTRLKEPPGPATLKHLRRWEERLAWLDALPNARFLLSEVANTKIKEFATQAHSLEAGDMRDVYDAPRRYTLLLCLLYQAQVYTRDQLVTMLLKRMRLIHNRAKERLRDLQDQHREMTEQMVSALAEIAHHATETEADAAFGRQVRHVLAVYGGPEALTDQYRLVSAYHHHNYLPLIWTYYRSQRTVLFRLMTRLDIRSATQDQTLLRALHFIQYHQPARRDYLPDEIALDFATQRWQTLIRTSDEGQPVLRRRELETCVFSYLADALRSGDLFVAGSEEYADYRSQLLSWDACRPRVDAYCEALEIPNTPTAFVEHLRARLTHAAQQLDESMPANAELSFDADGKPYLRREGAQPIPPGTEALEAAIQARMPEHGLLDILKRVQYWVDYTRHFGPLSGSQPKLTDPIARYIVAVFGYGCNLGPAQTARHTQGLVTLRSLQRINDQHITTATLEAALRDVIHDYTRFQLPFLWGTGRAAVADGTQIELRENNLLGERHIRYGGYGGIAYHHISDTYIALFSHFIACGVWEAVYILDGLLKNESDLQPDTLHADTQGQSEPVFGLAYLLGIKLMPRIRNWRSLTIYRPDKDSQYQHIDSLFTQVIDWKLIETHWQDLLQVVLSIQAGKVLPSMLLQKLGSYSRQNRLSQAFRELGCAARTLFLLEYISDPLLRQYIQAATTKIESYNNFLDWIAFGGHGVLTPRDPVEQEKRIKYMDLVANAVMLHNVVDMTNILHQLAQEGYAITAPMVARLSPYLTQHIKRFGDYVLDMDARPDPLQPDKAFLTV
jgi:TnpA family transposase